MIEVQFLRDFTVNDTPYTRGDVLSVPLGTARFLIISQIAGFYTVDRDNDSPPGSTGGATAAVDPNNPAVLIITP